MSARINAIADAVKDALNGGTFSQEFTAERTYQPTYELEDLDTLHVSVVPKSSVKELVSRSTTTNAVAVDIGILQKLSNLDNATIDPLMQFAEEVAEFFKTGFLGDTGAMWIHTDHDPIFVPEHLDQYRQFTSVITVTFKL